MKTIRSRTISGNRMKFQRGKIGWIILWLVGIPIPILLVLFLLRGCT